MAEKQLSAAEKDKTQQESPYERLLTDAMHGDKLLFVREDVVEAAWSIVDPVLNNAVPLANYSPGTWGPEEADRLAADVGGSKPYLCAAFNGSVQLWTSAIVTLFLGPSVLRSFFCGERLHEPGTAPVCFTVTKTSRTFSFRTATTFFACSSVVPPSRSNPSTALLNTAIVWWYRSTRI